MGSEHLPQILCQKTKPGDKWVVLWLLRTFRDWIAGTPRDKVYALLGLSDIGMDSGRDSIEVASIKSTKQVYPKP